MHAPYPELAHEGPHRSTKYARFRFCPLKFEVYPVAKDFFPWETARYLLCRTIVRYSGQKVC